MTTLFSERDSWVVMRADIVLAYYSARPEVGSQVRYRTNVRQVLSGLLQEHKVNVV